MKVVICDDDKYFVEQIVKYLKQYANKFSQSFLVKKFYHADDFLNYIENNDVDILFLDLIFRNERINGIDIAKEVRKINHKTKIVFLTTEERYAIQGYAVEASGYFVKPISYNDFQQQLNLLLSELKKVSVLVDKTDKGYVVLDVSEVMYVETENRKTSIHTLTDKYISMKTMKEQEKIFCEKRFSRCHSSYIVNFQYIKTIKGLDIILKNGERISMSKYKRKKVMDDFLEYLDSYILV